MVDNTSMSQPYVLFLNRGNIEGTKSEDLCLMFVYYYEATHFVCVCLAIGFVDRHDKRLI